MGASNQYRENRGTRERHKGQNDTAEKGDRIKDKTPVQGFMLGQFRSKHFLEAVQKKKNSS